MIIYCRLYLLAANGWLGIIPPTREVSEDGTQIIGVKIPSLLRNPNCNTSNCPNMPVTPGQYKIKVENESGNISNELVFTVL